MIERSGRKHKTSHDHELGADVINMDVLLKMIFQVKHNPQQNLNVFFIKLEHIILKFIKKAKLLE